jgi:phosphoesterase RecJ-like protein
MNISDVAARLRGMDRVLMLTHVRPDGDTIGSASALCQALRDIKVYFFLRSFHPVSLRERVCSLRGRLPRT